MKFLHATKKLCEFTKNSWERTISPMNGSWSSFSAARAPRLRAIFVLDLRRYGESHVVCFKRQITDTDPSNADAASDAERVWQKPQGI